MGRFNRLQKHMLSQFGLQRLVVLVGLEKDRHDRAGIHQHLAGQEPPNPSKYSGSVLRPRIVPFTARINPAFFACS